MATDVPPASAPCWVSATEAQLVFAGIDGRLYGVAFEESDAPSAMEKRPRALAWRVPDIEPQDVHVSELARSADGALPDILIASVRTRRQTGDELRFSEPQIWWLKLADGFTAVEAAGRLTPVPRLALQAWGPTLAWKPGWSMSWFLWPLAAFAQEAAERYPSVGYTSDHRLCLAYLSKMKTEEQWSLKIAPLAVGLRGGVAVGLGAPAQTLAEGCTSTSSAFSGDGCSVFAFREGLEPIKIPLPLTLTNEPAGAGGQTQDEPTPW